MYTFFGTEVKNLPNLSIRKGESVKFQWEDDEDEDYYFEMAIE